jgi:hypothetical protein
MVLLISLVLALVPLLGIAWIVMYSSAATVDGLFMSLILLAISGLFGGNALVELRRRRSAPAATQPGAAVRGSAVASASGIVTRGRVQRVEFFESSVGQVNKSIVTLADGDASSQMLVLEGDVRNALPAGQKVQITFRKANGNNVLVSVSYS